MMGIKRLRSLKISENWYKRTTRNKIWAINQE